MLSAFTSKLLVEGRARRLSALLPPAGAPLTDIDRTLVLLFIWHQQFMPVVYIIHIGLTLDVM